MFRKPASAQDRDDERKRKPRGLPPNVMLAVGFLAAISLIGGQGFGISRWFAILLMVVDVAAAGCFIADLALLLRRARDQDLLLRSRWYEYALIILFGVGLLMLAILFLLGILEAMAEWTMLDSPGIFFLILIRLFVLLNIAIRLLRSQARLLALGFRAEYMLMGSFALLVLVGWALLMLPRANAPGIAPIPAIDALFTATSAVCVTGLTVRDTGIAFSGFGQTIIALLFQVGGMGIITFVALVSLLSGKALSVPQMVTLREIVNAHTISEVKRYILGIVLITLGIELIGALLLYASLPDSLGTGLLRAKWAIFHAISAFCNAGFGLHADSLSGYVGNWGINLTAMGLIVIGGLGFPVLLDILALRISTFSAYRRWRFFRHRTDAPIRRSRLSLQTRITLAMTAVLILVGTAGIWALEARHLLAPFSVPVQGLAAMFQAITPRTAGFNTLDISQMRTATQLWTMALMVIGAGPVSTGGGIKTVAFGVLLLTLRTFLTGRKEVEAFGRAIPPRVVHAAVGVFIIYILVAGITLFFLTITDPQMALRDQLFETISALSTVGLSTGITQHFSDGGKLLLCAAMFIGRIGPLTLAMSVIRSARSSQHYRFPEEEVVVS